jgi:hydroxypyruvate isomerase
MKFDILIEIVQKLSQQLNNEHNEDSRKALRNLGMIAKYQRSDRLGVELVIVLSKVLGWDNASLLHDVESVMKGVIEKMNTGSAVMGILETLKKLEPPSLQFMLEYLMELIKQRTNIGFFAKEIGVRLKEVRRI